MTERRDARGRTPLAVALHYDDETDEAPRVTATGRGAVAESPAHVYRAGDRAAGFAEWQAGEGTP